MYTRITGPPILYIKNIIPGDMGIPLLGYRALSGWGYADIHAGVNFRFTEFSEVGTARLGRHLAPPRA
jgi:hypothetical protein